ncbi:hypothetical protein OF83DRAFT_1178747 [Amylostereum chailletii]|nr:hypothetical protein OF83DRAFT_1178747 [Amylostereum chailletii]
MGSCKIFEDALDPGDQGIRVTTGAMGPIFCVDMDQRSRYLALGAGAEVHIAKPLETSFTQCFQSLYHCTTGRRKRMSESEPPQFIYALELPRSSCWDLKKLAFTWRIEPSAGDHLGHASISQDSRFILAAMLNSTMDLHDTSRPHDRVHSFPYSRPQSRYRHPVKTAFLHNSKAVLCGSEKGDVCIWDRKSGALLQALPHNNEVVLEVCAQQIRDVAYIGTATDFASGKSASIAIWKTELGGGLNSFVIDSIRVNYYLYLQETVENVAYNFQRHLGLVVVSIITVAVAVAAALGLHGPVVLFLHPGCENLACGLRTYVKSALCTLEFVVSFVEAKGK